MNNFIDNIRNRNIDLRIRPEFLDHLRISEHKGWWVNTKGDHYTLLCWISEQFNNTTIYDVGTFRGMSALALAANPTNKVITYDIHAWPDDRILNPPSNIEFMVGNFFEDKDILKSPLIMFDVDPHNGIIEREFLNWLDEKDYKGIVFFDDIHLNPAMQAIWDSINKEKYDLTDIGHYSGSGIAIYN